MNTFGTHFRLTTYGESHGASVGGVVDGCPAGLALDREAITRDLARRQGYGTESTPRHEPDEVLFLSGIKEGVTLGTPIAFELRNLDQRSDDYAALKGFSRPGHADRTYLARYGLRDQRGGGRASARETAARVVAGALAKQLIPHISIQASVAELGPERQNDTRGGIVQCTVTGLPAGVGSPVFGKLNARLAAAMMSIPSAIGFEMGDGFATALMSGSRYIDRWAPQADGTTLTNHCGGVQGGISNGMPVTFRVAFHPVATLPVSVECLGDDGTLRSLTPGGRHDRCQVLRTPVIIEAMAALVIVDSLMESNKMQ